MDGNKMNLIDTNVIIRFLTADKTSKFEGVYKLFSRLEDGLEKVEIKPLVFFQCIFVLKSFYKLDREKIYYLLDAIVNLQGVYMEKKQIYLRTLEIFNNSNIEIMDSYLIACIEEKPETSLYSFDKDFDKFNVKRIEP